MHLKDEVLGTHKPGNQTTACQGAEALKQGSEDAPEFREPDTSNRENPSGVLEAHETKEVNKALIDRNKS